MEISEQDVEFYRKLDEKFANNGVSRHARPFRAAIEILGNRFVFGAGRNGEVDEITSKYRAINRVENFVPDHAFGGLAVSIDQVHRIFSPIVFGLASLRGHQLVGFKDDAQWMEWARGDLRVIRTSHLSACDIFETSRWLELLDVKSSSTPFWLNAASNLVSSSAVLSAGGSVDAVLQTSHLTCELAIKAVLIEFGGTEAELTKIGHKLNLAADKVASKKSSAEDALIKLAIRKFPNYTESRYAPSPFTRIETAKLAVASQFVLAAMVRKFLPPDLGRSLRKDDCWLENDFS